MGDFVVTEIVDDSAIDARREYQMRAQYHNIKYISIICKKPL